MLAFLPGRDGPRIRGKMGLQLELDGYTKARAIASIRSSLPATNTAGAGSSFESSPFERARFLSRCTL